MSKRKSFLHLSSRQKWQRIEFQVDQDMLELEQEGKMRVSYEADMSENISLADNIVSNEYFTSQQNSRLAKNDNNNLDTNSKDNIGNYSRSEYEDFMNNINFEDDTLNMIYLSSDEEDTTDDEDILDQNKNIQQILSDSKSNDDKFSLKSE